jgi:hypothetical protein
MKVLMMMVLGIVPLLLRGEIIETPRFEEVLEHLEAASCKVLVVSDLDNTLMRATSQFGSVEWGDQLICELEEKGLSFERARLIENAIWGAVQSSIKVRAVGERTCATIEEIQKRKIPFLGLTGRAPVELECTCKQLRSLGIHFEHEMCLPQESIIFPFGPDAVYARGILFATPFHKKSRILFAFLDKCEVKPECIVFIDDKRENVEDIAEACKERGIRYVGIRLSAMDDAASHFNRELAAIQWEAFPRSLSDKEAERVLEWRKTQAHASSIWDIKSRLSVGSRRKSVGLAPIPNGKSSL